MQHRPLTNLILWQEQATVLDQPARTLQFASLSFDASFQEMFFTWHSGGTLVLVAQEMRRDAVALLDFLDQAAIERLFLPFVALQHLAEVAVGQDAVAPGAFGPWAQTPSPWALYLSSRTSAWGPRGPGALREVIRRATAKPIQWSYTVEKLEKKLGVN